MQRAASTPAEIWIELPRKGQRAVTLQPCTGSPTTGGVTGHRSLANPVGACSPAVHRLVWCRLQPKLMHFSG